MEELGGRRHERRRVEVPLDDRVGTEVGDSRAEDVTEGHQLAAAVRRRGHLHEGELPLAGMTIVVSGSVPGYTRTTVAEMIEARGGRSSSSISAATSVLVSEPSTSAKYVKAGKLGVRILTPQEFLELAGG